MCFFNSFSKNSDFSFSLFFCFLSDCFFFSFFSFLVFLLLWVENKMPIIYALVARGSNVLAEYSSSTGNFTQITRRILEKIPQQDGKMSYVYDR